MNRIDPAGAQDLCEVMAAVCIIGILATLANSYHNARNGNDPFPDAAMWGISGSVAVSGLLAGPGASVGALGSLGFSALSQNDVQAQIEATMGRTVGYALGTTFVDVLSASLGGQSLAQLSYTVGLELLATATDRTLSEWFYHGPGINLGLNNHASVSGSLTLYGGTVWKVPTWDAYKGPFKSFATMFGLDGWGLTVGYFYSASDPDQNGVLSGATVGTGEPAPLWNGGGYSYIYYSPIWHTDSAGTNTFLRRELRWATTVDDPLGLRPDSGSEDAQMALNRWLRSQLGEAQAELLEATRRFRLCTNRTIRSG